MGSIIIIVKYLIFKNQQEKYIPFEIIFKSKLKNFIDRNRLSTS